MIARVLLYIKHKLPLLWFSVDWVNAHLYRRLHESRVATHIERVFEEFALDGFDLRPVLKDDLQSLAVFLSSQPVSRLKYFKPHGFDEKNLIAVFRNPSFLMFGVFAGSRPVGYFFLRCFWNRKCFVGRLVDESVEGRGIGRVMNQIMYQIAWRSGFRCFTSISKDNEWIMRAHRNNPHATIVGELANNYLMVEFHPDARNENGLGEIASHSERSR